MNMEKEVLTLNIEDVLPNRFQPRIKFKEENINELAESIKEHGVIQPIVVRKISDKYEIIAGERRYKASILAGKTTIPAIVTNLDDKDSAEIALIENVQRQDLTPIEEAISYKKILDMGYINQTDLAVKLGKTQSTIANKLRLLNLDESVQDALLNEQISERHARSLLRLDRKDQASMLERIISERMTVRKTDEEINKILNGNNTTNEGEQKEIEPVQSQVETSEIKEEATEVVPDVEVLNFDLKEEQPEEKLEKTMEIPNIEEIKTGVENIMNENQFNIPSTPIIEQPTQEANMVSQESINQIPSVESVEQPQPAVPVQPEIPSVPQETPEVSVQPIPQPAVPVQSENVEQPQVEIPTMPIQEEAPQMPTMPVIDTMLPEENVQEQSVEPEIPVENIGTQQIEQPEQPTGARKFFGMFNLNNQDKNFVENIENQQVNMSMEEETPLNPFNLTQEEAPQMPVEQPQPEVPVQPEVPAPPITEQNSPFENNNPQTLNVEEIQSIPDVEIPQDEDTSPDLNYQVQPIVQQEIVNPTVQSVEQPQPVTGNLRLAINTIRECANTIEKYGFNIDTEELDFEDMYQVTFKIDKGNN